ncbi:MAG: Sarcosine oxidase subunit alpha [Alphaproteobacteria bacterium MarineAlpha5_Bin9]|nr:MAG: Sarcosine oxidase subunit alpha [Alphaproteobacteria bacterium MarineAlpha5_Bin9]|tara:strand:+ start:923 stop:3886 length:2964 start_codon:yes stop_codon:yes gene_type:complete
MTSFRIKNYGKVNRKKAISFKWENKKYYGYEGDSLASALLANNIKIVGRSFKYHRPRGIMSCGVEESGGLVTIGSYDKRDPNVRATTQELYQGLTAYGQNAFPNVNFDLGEINNYLSRFFAAGFYYKTFMGIPPFEWGTGTSIWMVFEKFIRKAAGMGKLSTLPDPDNYEHAHDFCDVLIVGSGPAGIAAAKEAADKKLDVILVEQDSLLGGDQLGDRVFNVDEVYSELKNLNIRILSKTTAFGLYDNCVMGLLEKVTDHKAEVNDSLPRQRFWTIRAKHIIIGSGSLERHIAFNNNDVPGVMTVNASKHYLNRYGVLTGKNIVISTNNDSAYKTAESLYNAGAKVTVLDVRQDISLPPIFKDKIPVRFQTVPYNINGSRKIKSIDLATITDSSYKKIDTIICDQVLLSGGWSPVVHLLSHRGSSPTWNIDNLCFLPGNTKENISIIGAARGIWNREECIKSGIAGALDAMNKMGLTKTNYFFPKEGGWKNPIHPLYEVKHKKLISKSFVDYQHDVTTDDIRLAHREGFESVEHLKRYTTLGMANDQGKMGNIIAISLMADLLDKKISEVGTTVFRPPYTPIAIGALAGRHVGKHFRPLRVTPMHQWNLDNGAVMIEAGLYQRPWYFPKKNETLTDSYIREATIVRKSVGMCDVTSLGKISIQGIDSTEFINRIYANPFAKLPINKTRYGIMLRDDGIVMDDGTSWRLSENEYLMTTSTAQAGKVMSWLEELLQTRWTDLKVNVTSVSEQWAAVAISGPKSRDVIKSCVENSILIENLPFMGFVSTKLIDGIPCRIVRISFSGELGYEIYIESDYANTMMNLLWREVKKFNGCLYGLEALGALRVEKGHVTGAELDGRVTIEDAGLGKMASSKKSYVGSAMRKRGVLNSLEREQLVGFFPINKKHTFGAGTIVCEKNSIKGFGVGRITSVTHSPELGHWIGIGFVKGGKERWKNITLIGSDPVRNKQMELKVVSPHMIDPEGKRMHV